jgi:hypothetical protein
METNTETKPMKLQVTVYIDPNYDSSESKRAWIKADENGVSILEFFPKPSTEKKVSELRLGNSLFLKIKGKDELYVIKVGGCMTMEGIKNIYNSLIPFVKE